MRYRSIRLGVGIFLAGVMSTIPGLGAGGQNPTAANLAQVTVTVRTRQPGANPVVNPDDVMVYEAGKRRPVVSWLPVKAQSAPLDLTVLVDDSILSNVGVQFKELADFFPTLPAGARVRVAYALNGGDRVVQDFTSDYPLAAKSLRIPQGSSAAGGSIYQSVAELLKNWPQDGNLRELLVVSDGIDINEGASQSDPSMNTQLQQAIEMAQKTNVPVYAIFARGAHSLEQDAALLDNGQGCLSRLTSETGGQAYLQGTMTPLAFAPYLKQYADDIGHQYVLTFQPLPAPKTGYQPLRVTTEVPGVHLVAPSRIFIAKGGQ
jgi:VWFA-related protein